MSFINTIQTTLKFKIQKADANVLYSDRIYPIQNGLGFTGFGKLKSFNLVGSKLIRTIYTDLSFSTIKNGVFLSNIVIPAGIYSILDLISLVCGVGSGIIINPNNGLFLQASDTTALLSIRFNQNIDAYVSNLLGLSGASSNISGQFVTYDLGIDGNFPSPYNFFSTDQCQLKFGFSTDQNLNINNLNSIPLTILSNEIIELGENSLINSFSSNEEFIGNIQNSPIYFVRIQLSNYSTDLNIANVNDLEMYLTFHDEIVIRF